MVNKLKQVVKELGIKYPVKEISEKTGHDKGNVSKYMSGKAKIPASFLKDFSRAYNLSYDSIFASVESQGSGGSTLHDEVERLSNEVAKRDRIIDDLRYTIDVQKELIEEIKARDKGKRAVPSM